MSDSEIDVDQLHDLVLTLASDLQERFGDREPTEDELHDFLTERLRSQGHSEEEIEHIMREIAE